MKLSEREETLIRRDVFRIGMARDLVWNLLAEDGKETNMLRTILRNFNNAYPSEDDSVNELADIASEFSVSYNEVNGRRIPDYSANIFLGRERLFELAYNLSVYRNADRSIAQFSVKRKADGKTFDFTLVTDEDDLQEVVEGSREMGEEVSCGIIVPCWPDFTFECEIEEGLTNLVLKGNLNTKTLLPEDIKFFENGKNVTSKYGMTKNSIGTYVRGDILNCVAFSDVSVFLRLPKLLDEMVWQLEQKIEKNKNNYGNIW